MDAVAKSLGFTSLAVVFTFLWCSPVSGAIRPAGHVLVASGPFIAIQTDKSARSLASGAEFYQGDRLWTGPRTRAQIRFSDGAIMTLRPDTEFSVDEYEFDEQNAENNKSFFSLIKGGFRTLTGLVARLRPDSYKVKTAYAIVGVRGTTYEVVDQSALYVAAWDGTISIKNDADEMFLGFGQDYNYATVTSVNSAPKGDVQIPAPLQETVDPQLQEALVDPTEVRLVTAVENPIADVLPPALSDAELQSLTLVGFAAVEGTGSVVKSPFGGRANDLASGVNPIIFDGSTALRQGSAPVAGVTTDVSTLPGFPVSWGQWNATTTNPAIVQPEFLNGTVTQDVTDTVFWITAAPTPLASLPTGTVSYTNVIGFQGNGDGGSVNSIDLGQLGPCSTCGINVNFGTAAVDGRMIVQNGIGPTDTWDATFAGSINAGSINATLNQGVSTFSDGGAPAVSGVTGSINGAVTGPNGEGIAGAFDFQCVDCVSPGVTNNVQGTVFATQ